MLQKKSKKAGVFIHFCLFVFAKILIFRTFRVPYTAMFNEPHSFDIIIYFLAILGVAIHMVFYNTHDLTFVPKSMLRKA